MRNQSTKDRSTSNCRGVNFLFAFFSYCKLAAYTTYFSNGPQLVIRLLLIQLFLNSPLLAQSGKLYEAEPYDTITINDNGQTSVIKVLPLESRGPLPDPKPSGSLRVRLVEHPDEQFDVRWNLIERIDLFEQRILAAAERLAKENKFDEAFEYLAFLQDKYPKMPGLEESSQRFLETEAQFLFKQENYERAWFLLDEVYRRNPGRSGLDRALRTVLDRMFTSLIKRQRFQEARRTCSVVKERYGNEQVELTTRWRDSMVGLANDLKTQAEQYRSENRLRESHLAARRMLEIWPDTPGARELAEQISSTYPIVVVAVWQKSLGHEANDLNNTADRRCRRLLKRNLFEMIDAGTEGGRYICLIGSHTVSDDGTELQIQLDPNQIAKAEIDASALARELRRMSDPSAHVHDPSWEAIFGGVVVENSGDLRIQLRRPHLRVESLLQQPMDFGTADSSLAPYRLEDPSDEGTTFLVNASLATSGQPREIIERVIPASQSAIAALRRGEVDCIARLFPAEAAQVANDEQLKIGTYRIPSTHILVPNFQHPLPGSRSFRVAMLYAIDRETILHRDLLGGQKLPGCQVISGVFPIGLSNDDPIGYAYDSSIEPRPFEPRLARIRLQIAMVEIATEAKKMGKDIPQNASIILAHPEHEIARVGCQQVANQLSAIGIQCKLRPLSDGSLKPSDDDWDFLYADLCLEEPLVNARQLLSFDGFAGCTSPYLNLAIRHLDDSNHWNEAGQRLRAIHRTAFDDTSVLPLWQLVDYFAYRSGLLGIPEHPVEIYQDVEKWRVRSE